MNLPDLFGGDDDVVTRALELGGGSLSWLALAADEDTGDGTTEFIASTPTVDRAGDSLDQQTWRLAAYRQNPVILAEHRRDLVVGRAKQVRRTADESGMPQLRIRVEWDESELNPVGQLVAHQHRMGFRRAVSVGFIPHEIKSRTELPSDDPLYQDPAKVSRWMAGYLYRHNELLEVSSVSVPANAQALQLSAEIAEAESVDAAVKRVLAELLPRVLAASITDYLGQPQGRAEVLAALRAAAPMAKTAATTPGFLPWLTESK